MSGSIPERDFEYDPSEFKKFEEVFEKFDADGIITIEYGVIGMPTTFFVNREGIVEAKWVGSIPDFVLDSWVEDLINGVKIDMDEFRGQNRNNIFLIGN